MMSVLSVPVPTFLRFWLLHRRVNDLLEKSIEALQDGNMRMKYRKARCTLLPARHWRLRNCHARPDVCRMGETYMGLA